MTDIHINVDYKQHQLLNPVLHPATTAPANPVEAQIYYDATAGGKCLKVHNGTDWVKVGAGVEKIDVATGETVIAVDNTNIAFPILSFKKSATQGTGVTLTSETDGLKVAIQDGSTAQKGIVQLSSTPSDTEEATAATPKGANITLVKATTATTGSAYTYTIAQGGTDLTTKIEMPQATTSTVGMVQLDDAPSSTEDSKAATPKGANVTLEEQATAETGYLKTYVLKQGGSADTNIVGKINIPKDFLVKSGKVATASTYATNTAYSKGDVIVNIDALKTYVVKASISAADNTEFSKLSTQEVDGSITPGDKALVFVINVKEGTADDEFVVLPVKALVNIYTGENGITIDSNNAISVLNGTGLAFDSDKKLYVKIGNGLALNSTDSTIEVVAEQGLVVDTTSKKIGIDNKITAQTTSAVYPVKISANGLITEYGAAVNITKVATSTIAIGSKTIDVEFNGTYLSSYATDSNGNICIVDMKIGNNKVTFSTESNVTATYGPIKVTVIYQSTALS